MHEGPEMSSQYLPPGSESPPSLGHIPGTGTVLSKSSESQPVSSLGQIPVSHHHLPQPMPSVSCTETVSTSKQDQTSDNRQELSMPLPNDDLQVLVDWAVKALIEEKTNKKLSKTVKKYEVVGKYFPEDVKKIKDESVIIDRAQDGMSGQGADMCQEEFLKKGLSKVATGKINSFSVFRFANLFKKAPIIIEF